jgi:predicted MFS family arabinose efflux permease
LIDLPHSPSGASAPRLQQISTRVAFFIAGFAMAAWAPLVPFVKARAGLNEASLGGMLLCFGLGSVAAMPMAGALASRFGCRPVLIGSCLLIGLTLPGLTVAVDPLLLTLILFGFGVGIGSTDCVANIQAVRVETASGRSLMSGFHGMFSLGGMLGAGGVGALLSAGATPLIAAVCAAAMVFLGLASAARHFLAVVGEAGPALALPRGLVLAIGLMAFVVFLTEGSVLDWSAVFLTSVRRMAPANAGIGYTAFACTMTVGRLTGDRIVHRLGGARVAVGGALCAAAGLSLVALVPAWPVTVLGYALVGVGCSNIVPVLYSAIGRQTATPTHVAVAAVTILGYAGILIGPGAVGLMAYATSLSTAFLGVAALLLGVAVRARSM